MHAAREAELLQELNELKERMSRSRTEEERAVAARTKELQAAVIQLQTELKDSQSMYARQFRTSLTMDVCVFFLGEFA